MNSRKGKGKEPAMVVGAERPNVMGLGCNKISAQIASRQAKHVLMCEFTNPHFFKLRASHGTLLSYCSEASKPRGPPKAYVTGLEDRLETLEALLQRVCPDTDFSEELGPPVVRGSWKANCEPTIASTSLIGTVPTSISIPFRSQPKDVPTSNPLIPPSQRTTHLTFPRPKGSRINTEAVLTSCAGRYYLSDNDSTTDGFSSSDTEEMLVSSSHGRMKINLLANEPDDTPDESSVRVHTKNSTAGLVEAIRKFKHMHIRETMNPSPSALSSIDNSTLAQSRRPQFWRTPRWEFLYQSSVDSPTLLSKILLYFPPTDLAEPLVNIYFTRCNSVFPLLHRPTFDRHWRDGLHHRNIWFTCVCLCLFAVASRWCNDERVLPHVSKQENGEVDWRKAGRQYFEVGVEIHRVRKNIFQPASLFEVQTFTLLSMYLRGTNALPAAWLIVGAGIRKAQDVGAHRKKIYRTDPNADDELWKRAFWHLVAFDRIGGATLGRACCIAEEDFDLDLPLEVDDEYWEGGQDTEKTFKQPPDVPSRIAAFNHFIKLTQIMAFTMRTMYAIDKSNINCGIFPMSKKDIVRQLTSAMEEWLENIPEHLKWKDNMNNPGLSVQSAALITSYYFTLILIHRPLISASPPSPPVLDKSYRSELSPLLSDVNSAILICANAAHSCARIVEVLLRDGLNNFHIPTVINVAYICAALLSYRIWSLKVQEKAQRPECSQDVKLPITQRIEDHIADAHMFVRALEQAGLRWDIVDSMLEELNASLPETQSQSQSAPDSPRSNNASHLGPISDSHPSSSTHVSYPMDIQSGQLLHFEHNQHVLDFRSPPGTEHLTRLQASRNLPTHRPNRNEPRLHSHNSDAPHLVSISNRPRSLSATLPPRTDEHPSSYTAKALRRISFSNLHAGEIHDGHQHTSVECSTSLSTPAGSFFPIDRSTVKYHDTDMLFDNEEHHPSSHHYNLPQTSGYAIQKPPLSTNDKRGYDRLEQKYSPMGQEKSTAHQGSSDMAIMPLDPYTQNICDPIYDGYHEYPPESLDHLPYSF